jgi:6-phosphogluconolactonase
VTIRDAEEIVAEDEEGAARVVAELLAEAARADKAIVLTGGSTPGRAYELAAELEADWEGASAWWGDERCVPPDDELSNYGLARRTLLERLVRLPAVHRIQGELEPATAAELYERELTGVTLDFLLLGIGPDGHTASLFPNAPALEERERLVAAAEPKLEPYVERVTLTVPALRAAREIVFLVTGEQKAEAAERAFAGDPDPGTPASLVRSDYGATRVVLDRAAASRLLD